jgi:hypothetical protein
VGARLERVVRRELERRGYSAAGRAGKNGKDGKKGDGPRAAALAAQSETPIARPAKGSLFGRRVGRGPQNLTDALARPEKARGDALVDTARPGVSATDRRAGGGSTARRNSRAQSTGEVADLEDSASGKPSRRSTRKSAVGLRSGLGHAARAVARAHAPETHAAASAARGSTAASKQRSKGVSKSRAGTGPSRTARSGAPKSAGRGGDVKSRRAGTR